MLTEQSVTYEESWRVTSIKNTKRTMARDYQYHQTTTKFKQQIYNSGYSEFIHQDDQTQSDKYNSIIRRHY